MTHIKTPVRPAHDLMTGTYHILDADGRTLCTIAATLPIDEAGGVAREIVRAVNVYAAQTAALELAKKHLDALRYEAGIGQWLRDPHRATFRHVDKVLEDALALTKEAPCTGS